MGEPKQYGLNEPLLILNWPDTSLALVVWDVELPFLEVVDDVLDREVALVVFDVLLFDFDLFLCGSLLGCCDNTNGLRHCDFLN